MGFHLRDRGICLHRPYIHFHEQGSTLDIINLDSEMLEFHIKDGYSAYVWFIIKWIEPCLTDRLQSELVDGVASN